MKYKVETIEFSLWSKSKSHLLINGSWTMNSDQFLIKREGCAYVFDGNFDRLDNRGWIGGFKKLNEPASLLYAKEFCESFYDLKYKVISEALSNSEEVWCADYKDIVDAGLNKWQ